MKTILSVLFSISSVVLFSRGSVNVFPNGARSEGMGRTALVLADVWANYHNQAALAEIDSLTIGINYENRFMMDDMGIGAVVAALPILTGTAGLNVAWLGTEGYSENRFGLAFGKKLLKNFSLGAQINYHLLCFSGYPNLNILTGEVGILTEPLNNLLLGIHLFNPSRAEFSKDDKLPLKLRLGIGYKFQNRLIVLAEMEEESDYKSRLKFGLEYKISQSFKVRAGLTTVPVLLSIGAGWRVKRLNMDVAFTRHEQLGYSPVLSLGYQFGK